MIAPWNVLDPSLLFYVAIGGVVSTIVVIIPGLGGVFALALMLPFAFALDPFAGIALLIGVLAATGTGNTVTSVLFGVPGSPGGVATILDGYPMARRGEGVRAVTAGLTASVIGGILGAVVLALLLPVLRPIVLAFGPPEFFILVLAAIVFMAMVGIGDSIKSLAGGLLGLLLSFIGLEVTSATQRYTFGQLYLWDGIGIVPSMIGFYAVSEMLSLTREGGSIASSGTGKRARSQIWAGFLDPFRHWLVTVRSSVSGMVVGIAPGIGDMAAQFLAYAQAAKTSRSKIPFGKGAVEGVIASDAATNAKDGGALIPTLAFGIPGSAQLALVLAALLAFGIQPGSDMLTRNVDLVWLIIWVLIIGNVFAALFSLALTPLLARLTYLPTAYIVPVVLVVSIVGGYAATNNLGDVVVVVAAGLLGLAMKAFGYPRTTVVIGFVLGSLLERNYLLSRQIHGWSFLSRPIVLLIVGGLAASVVVPALLRRIRAQGRDTPAAAQTNDSDT